MLIGETVRLTESTGEWIEFRIEAFGFNHKDEHLRLNVHYSTEVSTRRLRDVLQAGVQLRWSSAVHIWSKGWTVTLNGWTVFPVDAILQGDKLALWTPDGFERCLDKWQVPTVLCSTCGEPLSHLQMARHFVCVPCDRLVARA